MAGPRSATGPREQPDSRRSHDALGGKIASNGDTLERPSRLARSLEIREAFSQRGVRYLFIGKSGAILLGYPDTTQDADLFLDKSAANGGAVVAALRDLRYFFL